MDQSKFLVSTDQNIQKQYINIPLTVSIPGDYLYHDYPVDHNLGYIPSAHVWYSPVNGRWYPLSYVQMINQGSGDDLTELGAYTLSPTQLTVSLVTFSGSTKNVPIIVRIYLDN